VASVGIPLAKFFAIAFLALSVRRGSRLRAARRMQLYEIVEYIGRWSMIDVFVVAILASLVQLNMVARIDPGPASLAFALSVIFTMLSAQAFDPRQIWDGIEAEARREGVGDAPPRMTDPVPSIPVTSARRSLWDRVSVIWLVPLAALAIALGVGWQNFSSRGRAHRDRLRRRGRASSRAKPSCASAT
jgi:hypothetical protein